MKDNSSAKVLFLDSTVFTNQKIFLEYYSKASSERKQKIDSYSLKKDKILSLAASVLLKLALEKFDIPEKNQKIKNAKTGKPYLTDYKDLFFNLSHSEKIASCVIGSSVNGIDIELVKTSRIKMAERFFSKDDTDYIFNAHTDSEKDFRFYECWTLKEAFCKMCETPLDKILPLPVSEIKQNSNCFTKILKENYVLSVCTKKDESISFEEIKLTD